MLRVRQKELNIDANKVLFLIVLLLSAIGFFPVEAILKVLIATIQLLVIIVKAKFSFASISAFLINFCLLQQYIAYTGVEVYGLLSTSGVPIYLNELCVCTYFFNILMLAFILFTRILKNEEKLFSGEIQFGEITTVVLLILALILTILIFPSFPSLSDFSVGNRFNKGIIPFTGWSIIPYFFLTVAFTNVKLKKVTLACSFLVVFWYAFHGERVEAIGFMFFIAISYLKRIKNKLTIVLICASGGVLILVFAAIGLLRTEVVGLSVFDVIRNVIILPTACDVTHVFNCAVDVWYQGKQFSGITYLSYLVNCIPYISDPYSFEVRIHDYHHTAGGGLLFAEPVANFGLWFSAVVSLVYLLFIYIITKKTSKYRYLLYSVLCIAVFRLAWYGLNYPIITMLYFAPFVLFLDYVIEKRKDIWKRISKKYRKN